MQFYVYDRQVETNNEYDSIDMIKRAPESLRYAIIKQEGDFNPVCLSLCMFRDSADTVCKALNESGVIAPIIRELCDFHAATLEKITKLT